MEEGRGPGDFVLDRDPAPTQKGADSANFRLMSIGAKRLDRSGYHLVRK